MSKTVTYRGIIYENSYDDTLWLNDMDEALCSDIEAEIEEHGSFLTVKYFISDEELPKDEIITEHLKKVMGDSTATHNVVYSEITGFLWADQDLIVGGHDLLSELQGNVGKFLHMEITFSKEVDVIV